MRRTGVSRLSCCAQVRTGYSHVSSCTQLWSLPNGDSNRHARLKHLSTLPFLFSFTLAVGIFALQKRRRKAELGASHIHRPAARDEDVQRCLMWRWAIRCCMPQKGLSLEDPSVPGVCLTSPAANKETAGGSWRKCGQ